MASLSLAEFLKVALPTSAVWKHTVNRVLDFSHMAFPSVVQKFSGTGQGYRDGEFSELGE